MYFLCSSFVRLKLKLAATPLAAYNGRVRTLQKTEEVITQTEVILDDSQGEQEPLIRITQSD